TGRAKDARWRKPRHPGAQFVRREAARDRAPAKLAGVAHRAAAMDAGSTQPDRKRGLPVVGGKKNHRPSPEDPLFLDRFLQEEKVGMMSFDESGDIIYPRASQTQQVPAYDFQVSIHGWRSSVPKYPSFPNDTRSQAVCRGAPLALRL